MNFIIDHAEIFVIGIGVIATGGILLRFIKGGSYKKYGDVTPLVRKYKRLQASTNIPTRR